jgi:hypothetical protein
MRTKHFFLNAIAAIALTGITHAQTGTCDMLVVTAINPDTLIFGDFQVSIQFNGSANESIGYPLITSVQNCNGDTVATGALSWFGQLGQTEQEYPITVSGDLSCGPLTAFFQYMDNEGNEFVCPLTFNPIPLGACELLSISGFNPDSLNPNTYQVSVQYDGDAEDIIAGPVITSVLNCNGEIVATGNFFWFGQAGQTIQEYPVTITGAINCWPLTAYFQYLDSTGNEVICPLIFDEIPAAINKSFTENKITVFPNPANEYLRLEVDNDLIGSTYFIHDMSGKIVENGILSAQYSILNMNEFPKGIYFLRLLHASEQYQKIVKM